MVKISVMASVVISWWNRFQRVAATRQPKQMWPLDRGRIIFLGMQSDVGTGEGKDFGAPIYYLLHFAFVYLAVLAGFLLSFLIAAIFPPARESATISGQLVGEPMWIPEILVSAGGAISVSKTAQRASILGLDFTRGLLALERMVVAKDYGALRFHLGYVFWQELLGK